MNSAEAATTPWDEAYLSGAPSEMKNRDGEPSVSRVEEEARAHIRKMLQKTGPGVYSWCLNS